MAIRSEAVRYRDGETRLTGDLAWDDGRRGSRPGVLVCPGALDPHVATAQVTVFADEMRDAAAQLIVYGGAMHRFTPEHADGTGTPGVAYHAASDARSALATRAFLAEAFGDTDPEGARS